MVTWDGTILRVDGVAILDAEARRGEVVRIARHRGADDAVSYSINADGPAEAAWRVTIPAVGDVADAEIVEEVHHG